MFAKWKKYSDCESCRAAGGAWCISSKKCADDVQGPCEGPQDHIGKQGQAQTCDGMNKGEAKDEWNGDMFANDDEDDDENDEL